MGGGGGGYSSSNQSTSTKSIVDSYNTNYSAALNLSNVGNVQVGIPQAESSWGKLLAVGAVFAAVVAGWFVLRS